MQDPIIADFSPLQPPGFGSPEAAPFPGPVIVDMVPQPSQIGDIIFGPDNPASRDYIGPSIPTMPTISVPGIPLLPGGH